MSVTDASANAIEVQLNSLYLVRHGERLDEKKGDLWEEIVRLIRISRQKQRNISQVAAIQSDFVKLLRRYDLQPRAAELLLYLESLYPLTSTRNIDEIYNDSILTPFRGRHRARERALSLQRYFTSNNLVMPTEIYCSALIRAVETAAEFSTAFNNIPIYVSKSLATSAARVQDGHVNTFHTINELRALFPTHQIYCCDEGVDVDGNSIPSGIVAPIQTLAYSATEEFRNSDVDSITKIVTNSGSPSVLIVGHREGIRNMWDRELKENRNKPLPWKLQYCEGKSL
jgi:broad specificity phosphatase PhoE